MDHMSFLGNSIELITKEKIGILKENIPTVVAKQANKVTEIIKNFSKKKFYKNIFVWFRMGNY